MTPRRALITGASKGIGYVLAELLAAAGHRSVGLARAAPADYPGEFHPADLADRTTTAEVLDRVLARGPVDAVVNNVALVRPARIGAVDLDDLAAVYDLTIRVAVQATQAALPGMIERGWGRIVNITSTVTLGKPERTSYGAAKAAQEFCSRAWGGELATTGVTVNSVAPDPLRPRCSGRTTHTGRPARPAIWPASRSAGLANRTSRAPIAFLLSEDAGFITGQTLRVDGGSIGAG